MIFRVIFFVLTALGLAGFGIVAWLSTQQASAPATTPETQKLHVLVAARNIAGGALLKPDDLSVTEVVAANMSENSTLDTPEARRDFTGAMALHPIVQREVIHATDILRPGDHGFLAAVLQPGLSAVTVGVDSVTGSIGLIWPGDHVDVILTQALAEPSLAAGQRVAAETVLSGVRVIAIDQQIVQGQEPVHDDKQARTVTLEVTQQQAERISVAMRLGRISLTVQSSTTSFPAERTATATWAGDVSQALRDSARPPKPGMVRVFPGAGDGQEFHF